MTNEPVEITAEATCRLLQYLSYPSEWSQNELYATELARVQLMEVLKHLHLDQAAFERLPRDNIYGAGSEHFRAAAILYWLRRRRSPEITAALKGALSNDPDKSMARAFLRELDRQA